MSLPSDIEEIFIDMSTECRYGTACYRKNPEHFRRFLHSHLPRNSVPRSDKESIELTINVKHDSMWKPAKNPSGDTHDWAAIVECTDIIVDKIEFSFPQNFAQTPQVLNAPPFKVNGSGQRSFVLSIDIHFKTTSNSKNAKITYDLYLKENSSFSNAQPYKLKFQNPPVDFRHRLLLAGGVIGQVPDSTVNNIQLPLPTTSSGNNRGRDLPSTSSGNKRGRDNNTENDECDTFGQLCALKLRKIDTLSPSQKTQAERLISDVLLNAEQMLLSSKSFVNLTSQTENSEPNTQQIIKAESPSSSTSVGYNSHLQVIKTELPSSSASVGSNLPLQAVKTEVVSDSVVEDQVIKTEVSETEPLFVYIKQEIE